jgi:hypothetical protein
LLYNANDRAGKRSPRAIAHHASLISLDASHLFDRPPSNAGEHQAVASAAWVRQAHFSLPCDCNLRLTISRARTSPTRNVDQIGQAVLKDAQAPKITAGLLF